MNMEEKRRKDELLKTKKYKMLEKFEKIAQKARFNKDEFYREIFTPNSLALLCININFINFHKICKKIT